MAHDKDFRKVIRHLKGLGWQAEYGKHIKLTCPDGSTVTVAATPSDHRALANFVSQVRRAGVTWPPQR